MEKFHIILSHLRVMLLIYIKLYFFLLRGGVSSGLLWGLCACLREEGIVCSLVSFAKDFLVLFPPYNLHLSHKLPVFTSSAIILSRLFKPSFLKVTVNSYYKKGVKWAALHVPKNTNFLVGPSPPMPTAPSPFDLDREDMFLIWHNNRHLDAFLI